MKYQTKYLTVQAYLFDGTIQSVIEIVSAASSWPKLKKIEIQHDPLAQTSKYDIKIDDKISVYPNTYLVIDGEKIYTESKEYFESRYEEAGITSQSTIDILRNYGIDPTEYINQKQK